MNTKALAKSKRAHSQQGRRAASSSSKTPPPTTATAATTNPGIANKPHKHQGEKPHAHTPPAVLPSNWDRYEKQDSDHEDSINYDKQVDVGPKSKGSDYAYLISQAQAQDCSHLQSLDSFDASTHDFMHGVSSMLHVRGKSLLSWNGEDSFNVDDDATSSCEASFLSIDLHSLAEQLGKIDLPRRLFIEEDLLPMELQAGSPAESSSQGSEGAVKSYASDTEQGFAPFAVRGRADKNGLLPLPVTNEEESRQAVDGLGPKQRDQDQIKDLTMFDQSDPREVLDSIVLNAENVGESTNEKKSKRFEATAAEAELDVLLNSFSETKLVDSLCAADMPGFSGVNKACAISLNKSQAEAHNYINADVPPGTTSFVSKKVLDDFDSWLNTI